MSKSQTLMMGKKIGGSENPGLKAQSPRKNGNLSSTQFVGHNAIAGKTFRDQKY